MFDRGEVEIAVICGLPYVQKADRGEPPLELLAAPVMVGGRYGRRPVYFSDVVVRQESPFRSFADLRGASWAYNEPNSHSGYNLTRYHLGQLGEGYGYFSRIVEGGALEKVQGLLTSVRAHKMPILPIPLSFDSETFERLVSAGWLVSSAQTRILRHLCDIHSRSEVLRLFGVPAVPRDARYSVSKIGGTIWPRIGNDLSVLLYGCRYKGISSQCCCDAQDDPAS